MEAIDGDTGLPSGKLVWRIHIQTQFNSRHITYRDRGAKVQNQTREKASTTGMANMKSLLNSALEDAFDQDDMSLTQVTSTASSSGVNRGSGSLAITASASSAAPAKAGKAQAKSSLALANHAASQTPIDRLLARATSAVTAACKVRKLTLRDFNQAEVKSERAFGLCKNFLQKDPDDFTIEETYFKKLNYN